MRSRVNKGRVDSGVLSRSEAIASFKSFSASVDEKLRQREEKALDKLSVERAVDVFNNVFGDESGKQEGEEVLRKRVVFLELELEAARETIASAKQVDAELANTNQALKARVEELSAENAKLYALAGYLRHFEQENRELRFLLQDFFKPQQTSSFSPSLSSLS